jgi:hypothetical protein
MSNQSIIESRNVIPKEVYERKLATKKIEDELGFSIPIECQNRRLLIMPFTRYGKKDAPVRQGSVIIAPSSRTKYDEFEARVGRVLKMADNAYTGEKFEGEKPSCTVGEWVVFDRSCQQGRICYKGIAMTFIYDDKVLGTTTDHENFEFYDN